MTPVVRIDDEVWEWLKTLALPLEDTPNSVLRRVAGLDPPLAPAAPARPATPAPASARVVSPPAVSTPLSARRAERRANTPAPSAPAGRGPRRVTGEWLNRAFKLGARHTLFHKHGTLYERLTHFPGALCDAKGFVWFETEDAFLNDARLQVGEKVNVPASLAKHPEYTRFPAPFTPP